MTDQWTEDRKHKGPFPFTPRKVAEAFTRLVDAEPQPFISATIASGDAPQILVDALDIRPGVYSKSFVVTVRDVDDERPEDKLAEVRAYAERTLAQWGDNDSLPGRVLTEAAQDILSILAG